MLSKLFKKQSSAPAAVGTHDVAYANTLAAAAMLNADEPVIIKDVHYTENGGATYIEVKTDGIYIRNENEDVEQFFPLNAMDDPSASLARIHLEIRCQIAKKLSLLVPALSPQKHSAILDYMVSILANFAQDQETRVRRIIAEELKNSTGAPQEIIHQLMWDSEASVAFPILEFSPLLGDAQLLDLIASSPVPGALEAIAKRKRVSAQLGEAIIRQEDDAATLALLENDTAEFTEPMIEFVVRRAPEMEEWHRPLLMRPEVTLRTVNRIASFVSHNLLEEMQKKGIIPAEIGKDVSLAIAQRLKSLHIDREKEAEYKASQFASFGMLDAEHVSDALELGEHEFVMYAIAHLANIPKELVHSIIFTRNPRAITSLTWRAGLPMRLSIRIQLKVAQIPHTEVLYARDGVDYPMAESEMQQYLQHFLG